MAYEVSTIVPLNGDTVYLAKQRVRTNLSYSGKYTLFYAKGELDAARDTFHEGVMGLITITTMQAFITYPTQPPVNYYTAFVDLPPRPIETFAAVANYFSSCKDKFTSTPSPPDFFRGISESVTPPPGFSDKYVEADVPNCLRHSFERTDLIALRLSEWSTDNVRAVYKDIYYPDFYFLSQFATMFRPQIPKEITPEIPPVNLLRKFKKMDTDRLIQTVNLYTDRHFHQVGVIPCAINENGETVVLISRENYETKPWSFFTGKPIVDADTELLKRGCGNVSLVVDYYEEALREYYEESMGVLDEIVPPRRNVFVSGRERYGAETVLWPVQVRYDKDVGKIYSRVASYIRGRGCVDSKGKMGGKCKDGYAEKIDARWVTLKDVSKLLNSQMVTQGVHSFRHVYKTFLTHLV